MRKIKIGLVGNTNIGKKTLAMMFNDFDFLKKRNVGLVFYISE